jgi:outer membrane protein OmpA-like peptidoglycan-associated protein
MSYKFIIQLTIFILFCFGLSACVTTPPPRPCNVLIADLQTQGVQVIKRGERLRLILAADDFFNPRTTKIYGDEANTLADVAELTNCGCYALLPIRVTGYADNVGTIKDQQKRSLQQARDIAAFLWSHGIDFDRIHVAGTGARGSIASNETPVGSYYNRRVEINLP